jgi:small subunit ribosomal protein S1
METENRKSKTLVGVSKEVDATEESMEYWFNRGVSDVEEGEVVRGRVVEVRDSEILVDIGYKSEGTIPIEEFRHAGSLPKVGEEIEVYLESKEDNEGLIVLSKDKADKIKVWDQISKAHDSGTPVEGRVAEVVKGGLAVDVGVRAFLPGSQVDLRPVKNLAAMVGQTIRAKVIKLNRRRGNVVLSRRAVLEEEREEKKKHTLSVLAEGMVLTGTVKNLTDYGAFIDLGGIDGLLHVTDMSWGRVGHPSEIFQIGDQVEVVVLHFDRETGRVSLGYKQKSSDPWANVDDRYPVGAKVSGRIVSLTNYGAFVELEPGEAGGERSVGHHHRALPARQSRAGQGAQPDRLRRLRGAGAGGGRAAAHLGHVLDPQHRASLRAAQEGTADRHPDPQRGSRQQAHLARAQADPARSVGQRGVTLPDGVPGHRQGGAPHRLGAFVELEPGVDGLLHISQMSNRPIATPADILNVGDELTLMVIRVDPNERRIGLSLKELAAVIEEPAQAEGRGRHKGRKRRGGDDYDDEE